MCMSFLVRPVVDIGMWKSMAQFRISTALIWKSSCSELGGFEPLSDTDSICQAADHQIKKHICKMEVTHV